MEFDKDLAARQEVRLLCRKAEKAKCFLRDFPQEKLDKIVEAAAAAFSAAATELAELAVTETGFGNVPDKITKNRFASETVAKAIRGMQTVGVLKPTPRKNCGRWVCRWGSSQALSPAPIPPPPCAINP